MPSNVTETTRQALRGAIADVEAVVAELDTVLHPAQTRRLRAAIEAEREHRAACAREEAGIAHPTDYPPARTQAPAHG